MERFHLVGIMPVRFTNGKTGDLVCGTSLHCLSPMSPTHGGSGFKVDKFFLKQEIDCSALVPDIDICVYFNRYGKVSGFEVVKE